MTAKLPDSPSGDMLTGVFAGPVIGLKYQTPSTSGLTDERGEFHYRSGEAVTFLIGRLTLGAAPGAPRMNLGQLVPRVAGNIDKLRDAGATNLARLVQSLDRDGTVENGVTIAPSAHDVFQFGSLDFDQLFSKEPAESAFAADPRVVGLFEQLNSTKGVFTDKTPRALREPAAARNELRRNMRGIVKTTDVKIPLRDGSFVYADVFRPAEGGQHPVIMNFGDYGKAFDHGAICNDEDATDREEKEDRFFSGNPDGLQYENHETVNPSEWVPRGYVTIRVDARGVGKSPGVQAPLGRQEAEDYYDAIEWAAAQDWSNGKVGLWGMSYYAMSQHNVASLQPPHLAAMIAQGTDADSYNEYLYGGGLFSEGFWTWWHNILTHGNSCGERREVDWMTSVKAHAFNDPKIYGAHAITFMTPGDRARSLPRSGSSERRAERCCTSWAAAKPTCTRPGRRPAEFDFIDAWFAQLVRPGPRWPSTRGSSTTG